MTVPPALRSNESTEHYTPPSHPPPDTIIACLDAIDLDPASNSREIPNMPGTRHYTVHGNGLIQPLESRIHQQAAVLRYSPGFDQYKVYYLILPKGILHIKGTDLYSRLTAIPGRVTRFRITGTGEACRFLEKD